MAGENAVEPVRLGSTLFSLVEPHPGREVAYHRWYERDHFYAGCMVGPWCFAGRRWVATRALKELRYPAGSPVAGLGQGSYLVTYWILANRHDEFIAWAVPRVHALHAAGRMFGASQQVHTNFYALAWTASRDPDGVPPELALDHPYAGLAALIVDRDEAVEAPEFERWYREDHLPRALAGTPAGLCLAFDLLPMPDDAPANVPREAAPPRRSLQLYFLEADPRDCWDPFFAHHGEELEAAGMGRVVWASPFLPTVPGSDRYADEL